jgi:hypothetical protein
MQVEHLALAVGQVAEASGGADWTAGGFGAGVSVRRSRMLSTHLVLPEPEHLGLAVEQVAEEQCEVLE